MIISHLKKKNLTEYGKYLKEPYGSAFQTLDIVTIWSICF